jgi:rSAM/selenodomain-associated transferase 1
MNQSAIIILVKNPEAGKVKKRLSQIIGEQKALEVYLQMLGQIRQTTQGLLYDKYVFYSNFIDANDDWPNATYHKAVQQGNNLPQRIKNAFKEVFAKGYKQVAIIGSDCLELDERMIRLAFRQLAHHDFVLGPTQSGGYYLLGMNAFEGDILELATPSSQNLRAQTMANINNHNRSCYLLPELAEVITHEDLKTPQQHTL